MKKILSVALAVLLVFTMLFSLTACNSPRGTYEAETPFATLSLTFKGDEVSLTYSSSNEAVSKTYYGDYEIEKQIDDKLTIEFDWDNDTLPGIFGENTLSYEKGKDYIVIEGVKFTKVK